MPSAWFSITARWILREDTFELVVAPAIADLQFEAPTVTGAARIRLYPAIWVALVGALCIDAERDVRVLIANGSTLLALAFLQGCYYTAMLTLVLDSLSAPASVALVLSLFGVSTVSTAVLFWPSRRAHPHS
jgi:hypothetical protein